jgi:hypothetical protein
VLHLETGIDLAEVIVEIFERGFVVLVGLRGLRKRSARKNRREGQSENSTKETSPNDSTF